MLDPFPADSRAVVEICGISRKRESKHMVGCVHRQLPLCLGGRERLWKFGSAQPEGEPKETEDKEKQCSPFQRRWRGWVETRVSCLQNGRSGSLSGRSRLWNLLLLVSDVKFGGRLCGERGVIVVVHRRCRRQLQQFARKTDQSVTQDMVRFKVDMRSPP